MTDYENQLKVQEVIEKKASLAINDEDYLISLIREISSENKEGDIPYINNKTLLYIANKYPGVLFRHWIILKEGLKEGSTPIKFNTIHVLANLIKSDKQNRYEEVFDSYFELLNDSKLSIAAQVAVNIGLIAQSRPEFQEMISIHLMSIDENNGDVERNNLIKGYAIESMKSYIDDYPKKHEIIDFVKQQLKYENSKLKNIAQRFLVEFDYDD